MDNPLHVGTNEKGPEPPGMAETPALLVCARGLRGLAVASGRRRWACR
jgi:hypothetical protein